MSGVIAVLAGGRGAFVFNRVIDSDVTQFNVGAAALSAGWNGADPLLAQITVNAGVYVSGVTVDTPAFDTGASFPAGSTLALINNGFIVGIGGVGGQGALNSTAGSGAFGGLALRAQAPISITNNGTIGGGGGGGGGGGAYVVSDKNGSTTFAGGGGGGGRSGRNNAAGGGGHANALSLIGSSAGSPGTAAAGGAGGQNNSGGGLNAGGTGGNWGASGASGILSSNGDVGVFYAPGSGGPAGAAVNGNSNITWVATGTRLGAIT